MTREDAIDRLRKISEKTPIRTNGDDLVAITMAIQALSQEPTDAVSREAVKELIKSGVSTDTYDDVEQVCKWIDALPSVTQKSDNKYRKEAKRWKNKWLKSQKSGKWIEQEGWDGDVYYECSMCGEAFCLIDGTPTDNMYNYCPNCGAKMESEE